MTDQEFIHLLWRWGHFRNPAKLAALNVSKADLGVLTMSDEPVVEAVQSYQEYHRQTLDVLCMSYNKSPLTEDGIVGAATSRSVQDRTCMCPDFAVSVDDDPDVAKLWNAEEANWPDGCRREILIGRVFDRLPGLTVEQTDAVYWAICNNWFAAMLDVVMEPRNDQRTGEGLRMYHRIEAMGGNVLAYHYLAQNRCDIRLDGAWNSNVTWGLALAAAVGSHECGHGLGLNHVNDSQALMYPAITAASRGRNGYPNATDISQMKSLGYQARSDWQARQPSAEDLFKPRSEPTPNPTPPPNNPAWPPQGVMTTIFEFVDENRMPVRDPVTNEIVRGQIIRSV